MASTRTKPLARRAAIMAAAMVAVFGLAGTAFAAVALTTVSTDPYTNTQLAYHQTQVEPDTFAAGSTIMSVFQSVGPPSHWRNWRRESSSAKFCRCFRRRSSYAAILSIHSPYQRFWIKL